MKQFQARWWVIALACVAAGLTSRLVLTSFAPPQDRVQGWESWFLQVIWYAAALLLFLIHFWRLGTSGRPPEEIPGCGGATLWAMSAVLVFLVVSFFSLPAE